MELKAEVEKSSIAGCSRLFFIRARVWRNRMYKLARLEIQRQERMG